MSSVPDVTVVMRSKNADWVIGQALAGLFAQEFTAFQLVVVDSGSTDRTLEIVKRYPHRLIEIPPGDYFPGRVLNQAIEATSGSLIVFQNSDAVPLSPKSLGYLLEPFSDLEVQAAFGRQLPRPEADVWARKEIIESFPPTPHAASWITLALPWAAMRRSAWAQHPFYTQAWGSEDTEWGSWALSRGMKIRYVPEAIVMHSHNYTYKQLYSRRFIEGEADAFIFRRKHGVAAAAVKAVGSALRDVRRCLVDGEWGAMPRVPLRRAVDYYGYWKGHRLGTNRLSRGDADATRGQRTALAGHESNRE